MARVIKKKAPKLVDVDAVPNTPVPINYINQLIVLYADNQSSISDIGITNNMSDTEPKNKPAKPAPPTLDVSAIGKSTVKDVSVRRGAVGLKAADESTIKGVNVGDEPARGWRWWVTRAGVPIAVAVVVAIVKFALAHWAK